MKRFQQIASERVGTRDWMGPCNRYRTYEARRRGDARAAAITLLAFIAALVLVMLAGGAR